MKSSNCQPGIVFIKYSDMLLLVKLPHSSFALLTVERESVDVFGAVNIELESGGNESREILIPVRRNLL